MKKSIALSLTSLVVGLLSSMQKNAYAEGEYVQNVKSNAEVLHDNNLEKKKLLSIKYSKLNNIGENNKGESFVITGTRNVKKKNGRAVAQ